MRVYELRFWGKRKDPKCIGDKDEVLARFEVLSARGEKEAIRKLRKAFNVVKVYLVTERKTNEVN